MAAAKKERYIKVTEQITRLPVAPALQMMYAEILHLSEGRGYCYANNYHFEALFRKSDSCISKWIKTLEKKQLVWRLVIRTREGTERRLYTDKEKYEAITGNFTEQTLSGRKPKAEVTTPGCTELLPGVVQTGNPGSTGGQPGVVQDYNHNSTVNITVNTTVEYSSSTDVEEGPDPETQAPGSEIKDGQSESSDLTEEEKEKASAQKEKEASRRAYHKKYKEAWWQFYKDQNNGEEPPKTQRHPGTWTALKKIQQDLAAVFDDCEESGYQEFVYILGSWPKLRDYHRLQVMPTAIHKHLVEIRKYLREQVTKVADVPYVNEALDIYKQAFHQLKGYPASINGKGAEHVARTLTYLKEFDEGNTWEMALSGFRFIVGSWRKMEEQDKFYADNFTLSFINGNTSKIIGIIKPSAQQTTAGEAADEYFKRKYGG